MKISLKDAIEALRNGKVVGIPTETVYGLAASLHNVQAIKHIYHLKNRPEVNPLIIHTADIATIEEYAAEISPDFHLLAETFWPGSLTLILPIKENRIPSIARSGLTTAGFRIPNHPLALQVIQKTGPLVMPSANLSGSPSATLPEHVENDFGLNFPVLDGGPCNKGLESTILSFINGQWKILRLGSIAAESFQNVLGYLPEFLSSTGSKPTCPGQLFRHYAPKAKLLLGSLSTMPEGCFVLGFKERSYPQAKRLIVLGSLSCPDEVAENLYKALRQLDTEGALQAWVDIDFPRVGLWQTIAERLAKAAKQDNEDNKK